MDTVALIEDPQQQRKLMDVILADVGRLIASFLIFQRRAVWMLNYIALCQTRCP